MEYAAALIHLYTHTDDTLVCIYKEANAGFSFRVRTTIKRKGRTFYRDGVSNHVVYPTEREARAAAARFIDMRNMTVRKEG